MGELWVISEGSGSLTRFVPSRTAQKPPAQPARIGYESEEHGYNTLDIMLTVFVNVHVKPDCIEAFRTATLENARHSVQEAGIARFDVLQAADDPARFVLIEAYRTPEAPAEHKATAHYAKWRDAVAPMMAEPRTSVKYVDVSANQRAD